MNANKTFKPTSIAIALSLLFGSQLVTADEIADLTNPTGGQASIGILSTDGVNPLYRQYTGIVEKDTPVANLNYVQRAENGTWLKANAQNIGTRSQEFGVSYEKQGDWAVRFDYNEISRYNFVNVASNSTGIGTTSVTNGAGTLIPLDPIHTQRIGASVAASKYLDEKTKLTFSVKTEDKNGMKFGALDYKYAPRPISDNHTQVEAVLDYANSVFQVSGGYYASIYSNKNNTLALSGITLPLALEPDNMMQQVYVNGAYNFSKDTRANLKISKGFGRQVDSGTSALFPVATTTPVGTIYDLGGKVETTEIYGSITSKIADRTKLLATWKYEDRDDQTPYLRLSASDNDMRTRPESYSRNYGKLELSRGFSTDFSATAGIDYARKDKSKAYTYYEVNDRKTVEEQTFRISARKNFGDDVNASLTLSHAERTGSDWINGLHVVGITTSLTTPGVINTPGTNYGGYVRPLQIADRNRDKLRGQLNWLPTENLDIQFAIEASTDDYRDNTVGLLDGSSGTASVDVNYRLTEDWNITAWYANDFSKAKQGSFGAVFNGSTVVTNKYWNTDIKNNSSQASIATKGKIKAATVGAEYRLIRETGTNDISSIYGADNLPKTKYNQNLIKVYAEYPLMKQTRVRLDYQNIKYEMDDFSWNNFYMNGNGSLVSLKPKDTMQILGVSLNYAF